MIHHRRRVMVAVVLVTALLGRTAFGDPAPVPQTPPINLHMRTPFHVLTDGGSSLYLPPGFYLDELSQAQLEAATKTLQDASTELTAENASLKQTLKSWQPGWYTIGLVALSALAGGLYLGHKL